MTPTDATRTTQLHAALLRDWDDPTINEAELCERHGLTPDRLRAFAQRPDFARDVETLRAVRRMRQPDVESRSRELVRASLCALISRDPASAAQAKETRLAVKQLLAVLDEPHAPVPAVTPQRASACPAPPDPAPCATPSTATPRSIPDPPASRRRNADRTRNTPHAGKAASVLAAAGSVPAG